MSKLLHELLKDYKVILASQSPRRQSLMRELGIDFEVVMHQGDESYPSKLRPRVVPSYLAAIKSEVVTNTQGNKKCLIISADTIVLLGGKIINKPADKAEAITMLKKLSGKMHEVITGVCLRIDDRKHCFSCKTNVWFNELSNDQIQYYVENFKPYDKAGAYGIQEWIGYVGICRINGSFYNVMGLPVETMYSEIIDFIK